MNNVLLLTTPTVESMPVEKYFGLITANQVAGTGFFSDLTASLSDIFGGKSGVYRESMNSLCQDVTKRLKEKALELGANAVVGMSIDYDNISAKSMSMFMVSIQGTAVKLTMPNEGNQIISDNEITWEILNTEYLKKKILRKLNEGTPINDEEWAFIKNNNVPELREPLYNYYLECCNAKIEEQQPVGGVYLEPQKPKWALSGMSNYKQYLYTLEYKDAIHYVYRNEDFIDIIRKNKLFDAEKIQKLARDGYLDTAISLLLVEKSSYNDKDLSEMKALCEYFNNLPEVGTKEEIKGGFFTAGGLKYICACGCKNDTENEYCTKCGKNIYGITKEQKENIEQFVELVDTLSDLIK